jgi:GNAT superfamily N-acetyltransferase
MASDGWYVPPVEDEVYTRDERSSTRRGASSDLTFRWNPPLDGDLRADLLRIWVTATNAGGAVGFLAPVDESTVADTADAVLARVRSELDELLVVEHAGSVVGWLVLERDPRAFASHWRTLKRLQVEPAEQARGVGTALLHEAERFARQELGLSFLTLTVRGGTGTDALYRRVGYQEVGRVPGALRVAPDDDRDEIVMVLQLPR